MTKTDAEYDAEYEQDRLLRVKEAEGRIAANEAIKLANESVTAINNAKLAGIESELARVALHTKVEVERQIAECQSWLAGFEAQRPVVDKTKMQLLVFQTNDVNAQIKRLLALSHIEEWVAREEAHAKVYKDRLAVLTSRLETL
jgi:D-aminopeptidase